MGGNKGVLPWLWSRYWTARGIGYLRRFRGPLVLQLRNLQLKFLDP